jgi:hypothetical protein
MEYQKRNDPAVAGKYRRLQGIDPGHPLLGGIASIDGDVLSISAEYGAGVLVSARRDADEVFAAYGRALVQAAEECEHQVEVLAEQHARLKALDPAHELLNMMVDVVQVGDAHTIVFAGDQKEQLYRTYGPASTNSEYHAVLRNYAMDLRNASARIDGDWGPLTLAERVQAIREEEADEGDDIPF